MGTIVSKPRSGSNPPKKIRTRTYSGSSLTKKPHLFKSLSKRKEKSATLQPTRTGDNLRVASDSAAEPITATVAPAAVKASPTPHTYPLPDVTDEEVVKQSAALAEEAICKATDSILKEEEEKSKKPELNQAAEVVPEPLQVQGEASAVDEKVEAVDSTAVQESAPEPKETVIEKAPDSTEVEKQEVEVVEEQAVEKEAEPSQEAQPSADVAEGEVEAPQQDPEAAVAEDLVEAALTAGVESAEKAESEDHKEGEEEVKEEKGPEEEPVEAPTPAPDAAPEEEEPCPPTSEPTSEFVEALQQQSGSEAFADPNEVSEGTKNIEGACLSDGAAEDDQKTEETADTPEVEQPAATNGDANGHEEATHGDNPEGEANGEESADAIASMKATAGENMEEPQPEVVQE